jgi:hypothetical protein
MGKREQGKRMNNDPISSPASPAYPNRIASFTVFFLNFELISPSSPGNSKNPE